MKRNILTILLCLCFISLFAEGNKESNEIVIKNFEDQITSFENDIINFEDSLASFEGDTNNFEDQITLFEDDINNFEESIVYFTEHIVTTDKNIKDFKIIEYGSKDYYKTLDTFSLVYENVTDIARPVIRVGEVVLTAYLFVHTGGASGFLIPMMGVPTSKQAVTEMVLYAGKKLITKEVLASLAGAVGVARDYVKYGDIDSGTFLEWHDEAFQWVALYQGAVILKDATSAIKAVNTPDNPLRISGMGNRNISSMKNGSYAGHTKVLDKLPKGAKVSRSRRIAENIGVSFSNEGYPNFKPYAKAVYNNGSVVPLDKKEAFRLADQSIGINQAYRAEHGLVWHHSEDGRTLYLLDRDLHTPTQHGVAHNGGQSLISEYWDLLATEGVAL